MYQRYIQELPIFFFQKDSWDITIQIILAVVTGMAVVVALFQEKIKDFFNQTRLVVEINLKHPDCHQISLTNQSTGAFISQSIYLRIRITNTHNTKTSQGVEVIAANLWKITSRKDLTIVDSFLPMNLRWSHTHEVRTTIVPKSFKFCDLGAVRPLNGKSVLWLDTISQPNPVSGGKTPNIIDSGSYVLELISSGDNVLPEISRWKINFPNSWSNNEKTMMKKIVVTRFT